MKENELKTDLEIENLSQRKRLWFEIILLKNQEKFFFERIAPKSSTENQFLSVENNSSETDQRALFKSKQGETKRNILSVIYAVLSALWTSLIMVIVHNRVPDVQK